MVEKNRVQERVLKESETILEETVRSFLSVPQTSVNLTKTSHQVRALLAIREITEDPELQAALTQYIKMGRSDLEENAMGDGAWFDPLTPQNLNAAATVYKSEGGFGSSVSGALWSAINLKAALNGFAPFYNVNLAVECYYYAGKDGDFLEQAQSYLMSKLETVDDPARMSYIVLSLNRIKDLEQDSPEIPSNLLDRTIRVYENNGIEDDRDAAFFGYNLLESGQAADSDIINELVSRIVSSDRDEYPRHDEIEANLRFLTTYLNLGDNSGISFSSEAINKLKETLKVNKNMLTRTDLFPCLKDKQGDKIDIPGDASEDEIIDGILSYMEQKSWFENKQGKSKAHSGYETADIYPIIVNEEDSRRRELAGVVKGPKSISGNLTWRDISHQMTRPAFEKIDYLILFNSCNAGSTLPDRVHKLDSILPYTRVIYVSKSDIECILSEVS